jgi:hypothetical protein
VFYFIQKASANDLISISEISLHMISDRNIYRFDFHSLRFESRLLNCRFAFDTRGLGARLSLGLRLACALDCCAVRLQHEEFPASALGIGLVRDLLTFETTLGLLFQSLGLVSKESEKK